ncbi:hypothetical protein K438DRAFT_1780142 [Mycena galopus ATCC 62051]|nr:hypothetical protein K438DRAFT_1780142 [Mycena galopus ATCC 62051]
MEDEWLLTPLSTGAEWSLEGLIWVAWVGLIHWETLPSSSGLRSRWQHMVPWQEYHGGSGFPRKSTTDEKGEGKRQIKAGASSGHESQQPTKAHGCLCSPAGVQRQKRRQVRVLGTDLNSQPTQWVSVFPSKTGTSSGQGSQQPAKACRSTWTEEIGFTLELEVNSHGSPRGKKGRWWRKKKKLVPWLVGFGECWKSLEGLEEKEERWHGSTGRAYDRQFRLLKLLQLRYFLFGGVEKIFPLRSKGIAFQQPQEFREKSMIP